MKKIILAILLCCAAVLGGMVAIELYCDALAVVLFILAFATSVPFEEGRREMAERR